MGFFTASMTFRSNIFSLREDRVFSQLSTSTHSLRPESQAVFFQAPTSNNKDFAVGMWSTVFLVCKLDQNTAHSPIAVLTMYTVVRLFFFFWSLKQTDMTLNTKAYKEQTGISVPTPQPPLNSLSCPVQIGMPIFKRMIQRCQREKFVLCNP